MMITSLVKTRKLPRNSQPVRVWTLLVLGIFLIAGTHTLSKSIGFSPIDPSDSLWTQAYSINAHGDVVGRVITAEGDNGFLLSEGEFTTIAIAGAFRTEANGINASGTIVGRYIVQIPNPDFPGEDEPEFFNVSHGYVLEDGVVTEITFPGSVFTWPTGINDRGDIVGRYRNNGERQRGFLLRKGEFSSIDFPDAALALALSSNNRGDLVGRYLNEDEFGDLILIRHGFLFRRGEYFTIEVPGAVETLVYGINARGDIVGRFDDGPITSLVPHGFLLTKKGKLTTFDYPGASRTFPFGINARGDIVGAFDENFVGGLDGSMRGFLRSKSGGSDKSSKKGSGKELRQEREEFRQELKGLTFGRRRSSLVLAQRAVRNGGPFLVGQELAWPR